MPYNTVSKRDYQLAFTVCLRVSVTEQASYLHCASQYTLARLAEYSWLLRVSHEESNSNESGYMAYTVTGPAVPLLSTLVVYPWRRHANIMSVGPPPWVATDSGSWKCDTLPSRYGFASFSYCLPGGTSTTLLHPYLLPSVDATSQGHKSWPRRANSACW